MDKQQVTEALKNLLDNNKMDISAMAKNSPEVYDAFNKVVNAISGKYGSGENFEKVALPPIPRGSYYHFLTWINNASKVVPLANNQWFLEYYSLNIKTNPPSKRHIADNVENITKNNDKPSSLLDKYKYNTFYLFRWFYFYFEQQFVIDIWNTISSATEMNSWDDNEYIYQFALRLQFEPYGKNFVGIYNLNLLISLRREEIKNILNGTFNIDFGELYKKQMQENIYGDVDNSPSAKIIATFSENDIGGYGESINKRPSQSDEDFLLNDFGINSLYLGERVKLKSITFKEIGQGGFIYNSQNNWYDADGLFKRIAPNYQNISVFVEWEEFTFFDINDRGGREDIYEDNSYIKFNLQIDKNMAYSRYNIGRIVIEAISNSLNGEKSFWIDEWKLNDSSQKIRIAFISDITTNIKIDDYNAKNLDCGECVFSNAENLFPTFFYTLKNPIQKTTQPTPQAKPQLATKTVNLSQLNEWKNELGKSGWTSDWKKKKKKAQPNWTPTLEMQYGIGNDTELYVADEKNGELKWRREKDRGYIDVLNELKKEDLYLLLDQQEAELEFLKSSNEDGGNDKLIEIQNRDIQTIYNQLKNL